MKKIFSAALMGILALFAVSLTGDYTGVTLCVNLVSLSVSSVLGIPGVISLLILERILM